MVHHFWRIIFLQLSKSMDIVSIIHIFYIPYINKLSNSITYIVQTSLLSVGPKKTKKKKFQHKSHQPASHFRTNKGSLLFKKNLHLKLPSPSVR